MLAKVVQQSKIRAPAPAPAVAMAEEELSYGAEYLAHDRPYISVKMGDNTLQAIIDTGAPLSLVDAAVVPPGASRRWLPCPLSVSLGASSHTVREQVHLRVECWSQAGWTEVELDALVLPGLPADLSFIFGFEDIAKNGAVSAALQRSLEAAGRRKLEVGWHSPHGAIDITSTVAALAEVRPRGASHAVRPDALGSKDLMTPDELEALQREQDEEVRGEEGGPKPGLAEHRRVQLSSQLSPAAQRALITALQTAEAEGAFGLPHGDQSVADIPVDAIDAVAAAKLARNLPSQRFRPDVQPQLREYLDDQVRRGHMQRATPEPEAVVSRLVGVLKPDGSVRFCYDAGVNAATIISEESRRSMPGVESTLSLVAGRRFLGKFDLRDAFRHVGIPPALRKYFTIRVTVDGEDRYYQYTTMPFGWSMAPILWQACLTEVLADFIAKGVVGVYIDDILLVADTEDQFVALTRAVLMRLVEKRLRINAGKCTLGVARVMFLGYEVDGETIQLSQSRLQYIEAMPEPQNLPELRSVLGIFQNLSPHVEGAAHFLAVLSDATKGEAARRWKDR
ncbi:MAG: reverse transcriptase family protein, partial [Clostridia bacterium]